MGPKGSAGVGFCVFLNSQLMKKILLFFASSLLFIGAGCQNSSGITSVSTLSISTSSIPETQIEVAKQGVVVAQMVKKMSATANLKPVINSVPNGSVYCNGKYWTACVGSNKLICPDKGDAYCQEPTVDNRNLQQPDVLPNNQPVTPPANVLFCNGKNWSECPNNGIFICPTTGGDPSCLTAEQQAAQEQAAQAAAIAQAQRQQELQALQAQQQALYADYQNKVAAIEQQIVALKQGYYTKKAQIDGNSGIPLAIANGQIAKLTDDTNQQISELQLQEQQLYLDYQKALSQL